ncbi:hypothetical protein D5R81_00295 [Parashewanella spongiae]|uniref:Flagellar protein FliT n=1 Tax=Parashewanella spongiae TaxID=342950 RepID=A0A3A6U292_9GAMM|nr:hypothetical protein [Parashewanella spongiae]MCL1076624.1 hypothetical protein [Parashewanella spongiae]RJY19578.1 hypothetical protein D5R81_00295 [Parashewanella spongiae]
MNISESTSSVNEINAKIKKYIANLSRVRDKDFNRSEELASSLLELVDQRQKALELIMSKNDSVNEAFLKEQKALSTDFIEELTQHRQFYAESIANMNVGSSKVDVYKSVNKNR